MNDDLDRFGGALRRPDDGPDDATRRRVAARLRGSVTRRRSRRRTGVLAASAAVGALAALIGTLLVLAPATRDDAGSPQGTPELSPFSHLPVHPDCRYVDIEGTPLDGFDPPRRNDAWARPIYDYMRSFTSDFNMFSRLPPSSGADAFVGLAPGADRHRAAIAAIAAPRRVAFCTSRRSRAELERIAAAVRPIIRGRTDSGTLLWWDRVWVDLRADQSALAEALVRRFGDGVAVQVGLKPYPPGQLGHRHSTRCEPLPANPDASALGATLALDRVVVHPGSRLSGTVTLHASRAVPYRTGVPQVTVVRAGTDEVVGTYDGVPPNRIFDGALPAGGTITLPIVGGTADCGPGPAPALAPGVYDAIALVPSGLTEPSAQQTAVRSARVRLTIR